MLVKCFTNGNRRHSVVPRPLSLKALWSALSSSSCAAGDTVATSSFDRVPGEWCSYNIVAYVNTHKIRRINHLTCPIYTCLYLYYSHLRKTPPSSRPSPPPSSPVHCSMVLCFCSKCPDEPAVERLEPGNSMESFGLENARKYENAYVYTRCILSDLLLPGLVLKRSRTYILCSRKSCTCS